LLLNTYKNEHTNTYDGLTGSCRRAEHNPNSPFVNSTHDYEGICLIMPEIGVRFRCGSLNTNIVAKIVEKTDTLVKFETLSGSIYIFTIFTPGEIKETVDRSTFMTEHQDKMIREAIKDYLNK
jgi:hypothetical protein